MLECTGMSESVFHCSYTDAEKSHDCNRVGIWWPVLRIHHQCNLELALDLLDGLNTHRHLLPDNQPLSTRN